MSDPDRISTRVDLPAPLQGCLYCQTEGSTTLAEGRKFLGFGSGTPTLTCKSCGAVALFEAGPNSHSWRIRSKKVNRSSRHYYAMVHLGNGGWLDAEEALEISRRSFVQRHRLLQAERGDLSWLYPARLQPPPPLMSPDENVYMTINPVTFQQSTRGGIVLAQDEENVLDSGCFYATDRKVHLLGKRRDWSHKLSDLQDVEHTDRCWRIYVGTARQYYQGLNQADQIDAQLVTAVIRALISSNNRI